MIVSDNAVYIYYLTDTLDTVLYVGRTNNPPARLKAHKKTFGFSTRMDIIHETDWEMCHFWEFHYIWLFRSYGFNLYNIDIYGDGRYDSKAYRFGEGKKNKNKRLPVPEIKQEVSLKEDVIQKTEIEYKKLFFEIKREKKALSLNLSELEEENNKLKKELTIINEINMAIGELLHCKQHYPETSFNEMAKFILLKHIDDNDKYKHSRKTYVKNTISMVFKYIENIYILHKEHKKLDNEHVSKWLYVNKKLHDFL